jgi:hypothetical protein
MSISQIWLRRIVTVTVVVILGACAHAQETLLIPGVRTVPNGRFYVAGLSFALVHFDLDWGSTFQDQLEPDAGYPKMLETQWVTRGMWPLKSGGRKFKVDEFLERLDTGGLRASYQIESEVSVPTNLLCVAVEIPLKVGAGKEVVLDGVSVILPEVFNGEPNLLKSAKTERLILPVKEGTLEIVGSKLMISILDGRQYGLKNYMVRISTQPFSGQIAKAALEFKITRFDSPKPVVMTESKDWVPYNHCVDIVEGGVFDRLACADAPAGKYGSLVTTSQGHFEFAKRPGIRARFWGVNLCFDVNFMTHQQADELALRLARSGYNAVRLHHYDRDLVKKGCPSYELDPEQLDRLEYFFAALKRQGLYVCMDLYSIRNFTAEEIPDLGRSFSTEFKGLIPISEKAFQSWSRFSNALLKHHNPYTRLTWAEDPALIGVCALNEDSFYGKPLSRRTPELAALYQQAFEKWLSAEKQSLADPTEQTPLFNRFLLEIKLKSDARMFAYLRELGVKAPLTSDNDKNTEAQVWLREPFDFVDNHLYWNHPNFPGKPWSTPVAMTQKSVLAAGLILPRNLMASRVFGKPYTVSEFNYVWPNSNRSEGGILMAGYAGLQDWDGIYNFDYASSASTAFTPGVPAKPGRMFSLVTDPIGLLTDRAAAFLFLHGDIKPAKDAIAYVVGHKGIFDGVKGDPRGLPDLFSWLGMSTRIGSLSSEAASRSDLIENVGIRAFVHRDPEDPESKQLPKSVYLLEPKLEQTLASLGWISLPEGRRYDSQTGQLSVMLEEGSARLVTRFAECFVLPPRQRLEGERVSVVNGGVFGSVYVLAVDGKSLATSTRILVLHLTDSATAGTRFADDTKTLLETFGTGPHLVRAGSVEIRLKLTGGSESWEAWAVDASGRRMHLVPLKRSDDGLLLSCRTVTSDGVTLAYELVRKTDA